MQAIDDSTSQPQTKQCSKCKQIFPATPEYFARDNTKPSGLSYKCLQCNRLITKEYYAKNREKILAAGKTPEQREKKRVASRKYIQTHKEILRQKSKEIYQRNSESIKARVRQWRLENPEKHRQKNYAWNAANPEKARIIALKAKAGNSERVKRWRLANPVKAKVAKYRRKLRTKVLPETFTQSDWDLALAYFDGRCAYCDSPQGLLRWSEITADHFIPLSAPQCPGTVPSNMIPACRSCNSKKQGKDAVEWITKEFGTRKAKQILARIKAYFASLGVQS